MRRRQTAHLRNYVARKGKASLISFAGQRIKPSSVVAVKSRGSEHGRLKGKRYSGSGNFQEEEQE